MFTSSKISSSARLKQLSNNAVSIFTKTLTTLTNLNDQIIKETEATSQQIIDLEAERKLLLEQQESNNNIISKIKTIVE